MFKKKNELDTNGLNEIIYLGKNILKLSFIILIIPLPNTNNVSPITINTINTIVSITAFTLVYKYDVSSLSSVLYTICNPFVNAYNPFPAAQIVNITEIEIVPIDFEYTSCTIPNIISLILDGIILEITSNNVCGSTPVYCISVITNIINGINDNIV